jgi:glycosyltransferase involved in cell wall biosynthesis
MASDSSPASAPDDFPIIAFCHLSWHWVWQRPQQFLSRLARRHPVLFVETYCSEVPATRLDIRAAEGHPNVTILQVHLPASRWSDGAWIDTERRRVLQAALRNELRRRYERPLLWFNDPMAAVAFAGHLHERGIVYDCMDELSQFRGAPAELATREEMLVQQADVVFCGGQKMRRKRLPLNRNTHFFGTGVDVVHFGRAQSAELPLAPEIAALGGAPVLGYFGVIDERIDYELLAKLADARDDWHIMMVGPTAKVDPATFPQRPNLHWIGARPYTDLPALTKGFAVALMPFALNAATEFINPTKALEYMAAGCPVMSTALDEVKLNFGSVARVARSHDEFVDWCAREAAHPSHARIARGLRLAAKNTWEALIARMEEHIHAAVQARATTEARGTTELTGEAPALAPLYV